MLDNKEAQALSDEELDEATGGAHYKGYKDYWVQPGDTFWKIAVTHYTSMEELGRLNNIPWPYYIYVGQKLLVPKPIYW